MFGIHFFEKGNRVKEFFKGCGSFGELAGSMEKSGNALICDQEPYKLECRYESDPYGVVTRQDSITNISDLPITVNSLKSRFVFEGGEYEVYTQFNNWQTESQGGWQPLVTTISAGVDSIRSCRNATPFLVLWSMQEQRGTAFHLFPSGAWEMRVTRIATAGKYTKVLVEMGLPDFNFHQTLESGETLSSPKILCYEIKNKLHMDCYKLHNYMHTNYPRRSLPVIYNTWMARFTSLTYENVASQIPLAADLGVEYFCIDAGWFGKGESWFKSVGDWSENMAGAFTGKMIDIANEVRAAGMQFGLWLEPERANVNSEIAKQHPEYFLHSTIDDQNLFLDFANDEARTWIENTVLNLIDHYGIAFIKDDFNADLYFDTSAHGFTDYRKGQAQFLDTLYNRYPKLYISSCASGGNRLELDTYTKFDSTWPSDNENPYEEMAIYKNTILRLPPQSMERWVAVHSQIGFEPFYESFVDCNQGENDRMIACGDAMWNHLVGVHASYLKGYITCGPIGFSSDLTLLSKKDMDAFKNFVASVKADREFWRTAVARILCDTKTVTAYQYSDMALTKIVIQLFTVDRLQDSYRVYPELDETKKYRVCGGEILSGKYIQENGIEIIADQENDIRFEMFEVQLEEI